MAIVTVYDPEGNAHEKESIDASECVKECGWSMAAPAETAEEDAPKIDKRKRG